ncbi:MAG TPA: alpha/beta fold hydrolase [Gemmatimonadaceae bacterium]|nr:alpha/beta fold hydrolase [Gemmatimonadaceae bacterium]
MTSDARGRVMAFKRSQPRTPRLTRRIVRARGLAFAVFTSPDVGERPPLLCVNGGILYSHALLWPALAPLAAHRQLVLYDQRGRGMSQAAPSPRSSRIEYDAGDIPALRDALGLARWDILGHSWGGGIAMLAAARDAIGVRRLVLVDAVGPTSDWVPQLHTDAVARLEGAVRERLGVLDPLSLLADDAPAHAEYGRALYPAYFADREFSRMFAPPREESVTGAAVAARLRREGYDWRAILPRIAAATLVVHGAQDLLPPRLARETASLIPRSTLLLIEGAGHMPFWEQPQRFFQGVSAFLDRPDLGQ